MSATVSKDVQNFLSVLFYFSTSCGCKAVKISKSSALQCVFGVCALRSEHCCSKVMLMMIVVGVDELCAV